VIPDPEKAYSSQQLVLDETKKKMLKEKHEV
jgi:hypothetical protein